MKRKVLGLPLGFILALIPIGVFAAWIVLLSFRISVHTLDFDVRITEVETAVIGPIEGVGECKAKIVGDGLRITLKGAYPQMKCKIRAQVEAGGDLPVSYVSALVTNVDGVEVKHLSPECGTAIPTTLRLQIDVTSAAVMGAKIDGASVDYAFTLSHLAACP